MTNRQKVLNLLFGITGIAVFTFATFLTFTDNPIALSINLLQLRYFDPEGYYPVLTICLIALIFLIPLLLLKLMVVTINNKVLYPTEKNKHLKFYR